ncbi:helix-turn-helix transcriptional regulator [Mycolicibacter arupensis]|jgi:transcriptional regulator with XRE-family HTH domain|uniref:helix-turn-helix transcriptional regulator n=1 Tax=Mycolicibacter arupensis TaxID=342002 RepID=UPI00122C5C73|nr:helix-turn-helix transcriptional regulator [Mycolicibacter arupensis]KAA1426345.1 helix-turn-helix transcriptional regulator [Mycolicibacter arupensis]
MGPMTAGHVDRLAGNLVRLARSRADLSQRDLARVAGVPQSTIARIESGSRQPSLPVLARILAGVDLELRVALEPYDSHDDFYDAEGLSVCERAARQEAQDRFTAGLQEVFGENSR